MGQSATIYRVSVDNFDLLRNSKNRKDYKLSELSKDYSIFQGSFMAIEFILAKNQNEEIKQTLFEIFYPSNSLGEDEFESITDEFERYEFIESGNFIPFLDKQKIEKINDILQKLTAEEVIERYSSAELNLNGIYPSGSWHDDNSENMVFNLRQTLVDISEIKKIFKLAVENEDFLIAFVS